MYCQSPRDDRNEGHVREVYGGYIIDNAKAELIGNTDAAKFTCKTNADLNIDYGAKSRESRCKNIIYFEGAPENNSNDEVKTAATDMQGVPASHDEYVVLRKNDGVEIITSDQEYRMTPGYVDFTDSKRLIGDTEKKSHGEKILKITETIDMLSVTALRNEYIMMI